MQSVEQGVRQLTQRETAEMAKPEGKEDGSPLGNLMHKSFGILTLSG